MQSLPRHAGRSVNPIRRFRHSPHKLPADHVEVFHGMGVVGLLSGALLA